ncbi:hypothetical protein GF318_00960 [Candidatus Micrarchaeota archaeon]|nr:hypothetical protein [Candidatus Micrarchaeota archaeon]
MQAIEKVLGPEKYLALKYMRAADSGKTWKWNPFKPALSVEKAADLTNRFNELVARVASRENLREEKDAFRKQLEEALKDVTDIFGRRHIRRMPEYKTARESITSGGPGLHEACDDFSALLQELQAERELS